MGQPLSHIWAWWTSPTELLSSLWWHLWQGARFCAVLFQEDPAAQRKSQQAASITPGSHPAFIIWAQVATHRTPPEAGWFSLHLQGEKAACNWSCGGAGKLGPAWFCVFFFFSEKIVQKTNVESQFCSNVQPDSQLVLFKGISAESWAQPGDAGSVSTWLLAVKIRSWLDAFFLKNIKLKVFAGCRRVRPVNEMLRFRVICCDFWKFEIPVMDQLSLSGDCICQAVIEVANQYSPSLEFPMGRQIAAKTSVLRIK